MAAIQMSSATPDDDRASWQSPYVAGEVLTLQTPDGEDISATIIHVFPTDISPVMEVRLQTPEGQRKAVLKLYDRRIGVYRDRYRDKNPYNQQAEARWQECVRSGLVKKELDERREDNKKMIARRHGTVYDDNEESSEAQEEEDEDEEEEDEEQEAQEHESWVYCQLQDNCRDEVRAYSQLKFLQGHCIPRFIGSVTYTPSGIPTDLPAVYFRVPGILLEYLGGFSLRKIAENLPDQPQVWETVIRQAVAVEKEVARAGVNHYDCLTEDFIVVRCSDGKLQPFLIDFARSDFRADWKDTSDRDDEDSWASITGMTKNWFRITSFGLRRIYEATSHKYEMEIDGTGPFGGIRSKICSPPATRRGLLKL